jgi:hypothetical protein
MSLRVLAAFARSVGRVVARARFVGLGGEPSETRAHRPECALRVLLDPDRLDHDVAQCRDQQLQAFLPRIGARALEPPARCGTGRDRLDLSRVQRRVRRGDDLHHAVSDRLVDLLEHPGEASFAQRLTELFLDVHSVLARHVSHVPLTADRNLVPTDC